MKRITSWILVTVSVLVLLFSYRTSTSGVVAAPPASAQSGSFTSTSSGTTTSGGSGSGDEAATPGATPGASGSSSPGTTPALKKRTVVGSVASTRWGPVQVKLIVSGGRITQASVLQYPTGNPKDVEINDYALPILTQETVTRQSASIDMVSGATVTSTGYVQSLQSALDQAGL